MRSVRRLVALALFVASAALAAWLLARDVRATALVALAAALVLLPRAVARAHTRRMLLEADVPRILAAWRGSVGRGRHARTALALMDATAYAAYGFIDEARDALERAPRGPAWDAAIEQRLVVEAMLDSYEGDRARALEKARALEALPLPRVGFLLRRKVARMRRGVAALARALARAPLRSDGASLRRAAQASPLVHWAMTYGAAVLAVDEGRPADAAALLRGAPTWPSESAFRAFHDELVAELARDPAGARAR